LTYGLYVKDKIFIKPNTGGKVSWNDTISKGNKYSIGGDIVLYPLYYRKKFYFSSFITECMIFAIDYTIEKFRMFIDADPTGENIPEFDFVSQSEYVVNTLQLLRQETFRDNELNLIDNFILFFMNFNVGGNYYLKHYTFSSI